MDHRVFWPPLWHGAPQTKYFLGGSTSRESSCIAEDLGSIRGWGRSLGGGNGNPLQYSCLGNPMDRGAWQATVRGLQRVRHNWVTKSPPNKVAVSLVIKNAKIAKLNMYRGTPCLGTIWSSLWFWYVDLDISSTEWFMWCKYCRERESSENYQRGLR